MTTITGLTADRMLEIEGQSVISGEIVNGNLILTKHDGSTVNAGPVIGAQGPPGPTGPAGFGAIPGEVRLWPGGALPPQATWGKWVWADGAVYVAATYPLASSYIHTNWRTFNGASDPGAANFRVPDLRGLVAAGMDAMPGQVAGRANRTTRAVALNLAGRTGEETHPVSIAELPAHAHSINDQIHGHSVSDPGHNHGVNDPGHNHTIQVNDPPAGGNQAAEANGNDGTIPSNYSATGIWLSPSGTGIGINAAYSNINGTNNNGGGNAHENLQPTVFVPYIVCLHG